MKVFCATLIHETNPRSPLATDLDSYREFYLYRPSTGEGAAVLDGPMEGVNIAQVLRERGHEVHCGLAASAQPSRPTRRADYTALREELLTNLQAAGRVDCVVLFLHGAQMAEGEDDCEGDILRRVRAQVGADVPVGVLFDLHGNISAAMLRYADALLACQEYPHVDFAPRAAQLIDILERTVAGEVRPVMACQRLPMLGTYFTTRAPLRDLLDEMIAREGQGGILAISHCHGFAWANHADAGGSLLVLGDGDEAQARRLAGELAERVFALREAIQTPIIDAATALDLALAETEGPVVIADTTDNPGGGAAGDSTFLLREALSRGVRQAALAMIWDPVAVSLCRAAGRGARLTLRLGGKMGPASGDPLDLEVTVTAVSRTAGQYAQGAWAPLGNAVAVETAGIAIAVNSIRNQTFSPACFTELGIDPARQRLLIVKSHQHFHEHFAPLARCIIHAMPPGTITMDYARAGLDRIARPQWPIDQPPFEFAGRRWG